ncbi:phage shock protein B [Vibrio sagamiensis]|uniref:ERV/ALR sulfhydryl oxidase domain-containing protein n=1 Tax=Vibrio sagamiensis NBRC 104589 TaxID=1219064 RepID=A0A511QJK0_9VIBR|nr:phage shock protein B [Vibrio sagamiensis]GEM77503.1 hypothetical protein VSA01S_36150 [Vibrio sagamiensis NBRC 104589]
MIFHTNSFKRQNGPSLDINDEKSLEEQAAYAELIHSLETEYLCTSCEDPF